MSRDEEAIIELMRQLRMAGQLQHAYLMQGWQSHDAGLHPAAGILLSDLAAHGECRPSELAKRKMVDLSVISRQIATLVAAGLVERRPAPRDGRGALLRLSPEGETQLKRWREDYLAQVRSALADWRETELEELTDGLTAMNAAFRAAIEQTSQG